MTRYTHEQVRDLYKRAEAAERVLATIVLGLQEGGMRTLGEKQDVISRIHALADNSLYLRRIINSGFSSVPASEAPEAPDTPDADTRTRAEVRADSWLEWSVEVIEELRKARVTCLGATLDGLEGVPNESARASAIGAALSLMAAELAKDRERIERQAAAAAEWYEWSKQVAALVAARPHHVVRHDIMWRKDILDRVRAMRTELDQWQQITHCPHASAYQSMRQGELARLSDWTTWAHDLLADIGTKEPSGNADDRCMIEGLARAALATDEAKAFASQATVTSVSVDEVTLQCPGMMALRVPLSGPGEARRVGAFIGQPATVFVVMRKDS